MFGVQRLSLIATYLLCLGLGVSALANAQPIPVSPELDAQIVRKSGWWQTSVSMVGESGSEVAFVCVDYAQEAKMLHRESNSMAGPMMGCPLTSYTRTGSVIDAAQVCKDGFSVRTNYSGNPAVQQTVTSVTKTGNSVTTVKLVHSFKGACPPGFKAGDSVTAAEVAKSAKPPYTNVYTGAVSAPTQKNADKNLESIVPTGKKTK
jgi:hypothetical protein